MQITYKYPVHLNFSGHLPSTSKSSNQTSSKQVTYKSYLKMGAGCLAGPLGAGCRRAAARQPRWKEVAGRRWAVAFGNWRGAPPRWAEQQVHGDGVRAWIVTGTEGLRRRAEGRRMGWRLERGIGAWGAKSNDLGRHGAGDWRGHGGVQPRFCVLLCSFSA